MDASDRVVWHYAQTNQMMILTANRNMKGEDSLEQVMREEKATGSFPVVTIGNLDRLDEFDYRERCSEHLIEIVLEIESYMGVGSAVYFVELSASVEGGLGREVTSRH